MTEWIGAAEAAQRLGIKPASLYSYVSRGVLAVRRDAGSRRSMFDATEVETVARRGRPRRSTRPAALDLVVETGLTTIADHVIRYRGRDACSMARTAGPACLTPPRSKTSRVAASRGEGRAAPSW